MDPNTSHPITNPVRPALQKRSVETRQRILSVVERLLHEGRFGQASVQEIVHQAGCSVGAFYGRFQDKNAALFSFYDDHCRRLERCLLGILDARAEPDEPLSAILTRFTGASVEHTLAHADLLKSGVIPFSDSPDNPFLARARSMNQTLLRAIEALLKQRKDEFDHPDSGSAALFVLAIAGGLSRDAVTTGQALLDCKGGQDTLRRELVRMVLNYLKVI